MFPSLTSYSGLRFLKRTTYQGGERNGNPLQYSSLGNPMDRGAWRATINGVRRVRHDLATEHDTHTKVGIKRTYLRGLAV